MYYWKVILVLYPRAPQPFL